MRSELNPCLAELCVQHQRGVATIEAVFLRLPLSVINEKGKSICGWSVRPGGALRSGVSPGRMTLLVIVSYLTAESERATKSNPALGDENRVDKTVTKG